MTSQTGQEISLKEAEVPFESSTLIPDTFLESVENGFQNADEDILHIVSSALPFLNGVHSSRLKATITSNGLSIPISHFDPNRPVLKP